MSAPLRVPRAVAVLAIAVALVAGWMIARDDDGDRPSGNAPAPAGDDRRAAATRAIAALDRRDARATVDRTVDGDTVVIRFRDRDGEGRATVRYLGVDTPEVARGRKRGECFGPEASRANAGWVDGRRVRLRFDRERIDRYGRVLAALEPDGWDRSVSERLVAEGYARVLTIRPNGALLAPRLERLSAQARRAQRGLWAACADAR